LGKVLPRIGTQGPQGAIEAAAAALHRSAAESVNKLPHALSNVLEGDSSSFYENGYLEPHKLSEDRINKVLKTVQKNINKLRFLPQWVKCEATGVLQLQIFSAAPSYQGQRAPEEGSAGAQLCDVLLATQYEALAKIAVIRHVISKTPFNVHLTLVGQGAFNNPPSVLENAFFKVAAIVKGYPGLKFLFMLSMLQAKI
jgi:hypothetical protein